MQIVGHLHALWWWALDYADDGNLSRFEPDVIADACEWEDDPDMFVDALVSAGFLDRTANALHVHDWMDYAGRLVQRRKANAERMRAARAANVQDTCETRDDTCEATKDNLTVPNQTQPKQTVAEPEDEPVAPAVVVVSADTPYAIYSAFLEEAAEPDFVPPKRWKDKQIGIATRIRDAGYGVDRVRGCVRYMKSQSWRTAPFDLGAVEDYLPTWESSGSPERDEPKRGSPKQPDNQRLQTNYERHLAVAERRAGIR